MPRFALVVELKIKPGSAATFLPLIVENRNASLKNEEGCHKFIVLKNNEKENTFHFYEEYDDEVAFKNHQSSEHFKKYFESAKDLMVERNWSRCEVIE